MLSCKEVARLASDGLDNDLPFGTRFGMRLHMMMCGACSRYVKQLKQLHDIDPEMADAHFAQMKAASDSLKTSGMFQKAGVDGGDGADMTAEQELQKIADGIVEKSGHDLTKEQAFAKATEAHPELYDRYLTENPRQTADVG